MFTNWPEVISEIRNHGGATDIHWHREGEQLPQGRYAKTSQTVVGISATCRDNASVAASGLPATKVSEVATPMWQPKDPEDSIQWKVLPQ
jgi:hypothetical protein